MLLGCVDTASVATADSSEDALSQQAEYLQEACIERDATGLGSCASHSSDEGIVGPFWCTGRRRLYHERAVLKWYVIVGGFCEHAIDVRRGPG